MHLCQWGGYHLAEGCKPPLGNCFSFGPWIMPFGDSNPFCSQSLTHNWWVCVGWDRTAADFDACCHCSSPLVHLALGHPVSFQCSSISILTAESKLDYVDFCLKMSVKRSVLYSVALSTLAKHSVLMSHVHPGIIKAIQNWTVMGKL